MGLLDGDLRAEIGEALYEIMLPAVLHKAVVTYDDAGAPVKSFTDHACLGFVDSYAAVLRYSGALPDEAVKIVVLQASLAVEPTKDDEITIRATRYKVGRIDQDPAQATWELQGVPA